MEPSDWLINYRYVMEIMLLATASVGIVLCIDDFFVDLYFWFVPEVKRRAKNHGLPTQAELASMHQKPLAIMVPAWQEADVIYDMLRSNFRRVEYAAAHYFVGVYENDPDTIREVEKAQALSRNIHMVVVPRPGPTNKADCLNEIVETALAFEKGEAESFAGFILHDSEDLIHPLELQVFNASLPANDFVQLPVYSFTRKYDDFVASTYMDEFAEVHGKDLLVRELISGFIPCAGVAACFSHNAIQVLKASGNGQAFKAGALTEDYDAAFRIADLKLKAAFIHYDANFFIDTNMKSGRPEIVEEHMSVSTRENFPSSFKAAYRQRARWMLGIVFVGARELGWRGPWGTLLFLFRDRKGVVAFPVVMIGYFIMANLVAIELWLDWRWPSFVVDKSLILSPVGLAITTATLAMMFWRLAHRVIFTTMLYGWRHGIVSAPRIVVSTFINFAAICRATRIYWLHRLTGVPLAWDKTQHSYPDKYIEDFEDSVSHLSVRE